MDRFSGIGTGLAGAITTAAYPSTPPPTPDCLPSHINELARAVSALEDELSGLGSVLGPIVKPLPEGNAKEGAVPRPIRSELSNQIVEQTQRLLLIARRVRDVRESVDL